MRLINIFPNAERLLLINIDSVLRYGSALLPNYSQPAKSTNDKDDFISSSVSLFVKHKFTVKTAWLLLEVSFNIVALVFLLD